MKIIFFDSLFPKGHVDLNNRYIAIMQSMGIDVEVFAPNGWFTVHSELASGCRWYTDKECSGGHFLSRLKAFKNCLNLHRSGKLKEANVVLFTSYDIVVFFLFYPFLSKYKNKVVLQQHNNIDQLNNTVKRLLFNCFSNKVRHFVFEDYIGTRLEKLGVDKRRYFIVPHPVPQVDHTDDNRERVIFGLSNSNSDYLIKELVDAQIKMNILNDLNYVFVLKSHCLEYEDSSLIIFREWVDQDTYRRFLKESEYVFLPFSPKEYSFRVSNVFYEAIALGKKIVTSRFLLAEYYEKKYPGICRVMDHMKDIKDNFLSYGEFNCSAQSKFIMDHSDDSIKNSLCKAFDQISSC